MKRSLPSKEEALNSLGEENLRRLLNISREGWESYHRETTPFIKLKASPRTRSSFINDLMLDRAKDLLVGPGYHVTDHHRSALARIGESNILFKVTGSDGIPSWNEKSIPILFRNQEDTGIPGLLPNATNFVVTCMVSSDGTKWLGSYLMMPYKEGYSWDHALIETGLGQQLTLVDEKRVKQETALPQIKRRKQKRGEGTDGL